MAVFYDGEVSGRIHRARRLRRCLYGPGAELNFRHKSLYHSFPPGSDFEGPTAVPTSARFRDPLHGGIGLVWNRLGGLPHYTSHEHVSPNEFGLSQVRRPLARHSARQGVYRRMPN